MKRSMLLMTLTGALLLTGCDHVHFNSTQLAFARSLIPDGREDILSEFEWRMVWTGQQAVVYPVVTETEIVFLNYDGILLSFDGYQLARIENLIPGAQIRIERTPAGNRETLAILANDRRLTTVTCDSWQSTQTAEGLVHTRRCDGQQHVDQIDVDASGNMVRMHFAIHPDYPPIQLIRQ